MSAIAAESVQDRTIDTPPDDHAATTRKRAHTSRKCEQCGGAFLARRSTARFCIDHRGGASATSRYRAGLIERACLRCGRSSDLVSNDVPLCRPCFGQRRRSRLIAKRYATAERELQEVLRKNEEDGEARSQEVLEIEATLLLFRSDEAIAREYPVLYVDHGSADVLDTKPISLDAPLFEGSNETIGSILFSTF